MHISLEASSLTRHIKLDNPEQVENTSLVTALVKGMVLQIFTPFAIHSKEKQEAYDAISSLPVAVLTGASYHDKAILEIVLKQEHYELLALLVYQGIPMTEMSVVFPRGMMYTLVSQYIECRIKDEGIKDRNQRDTLAHIKPWYAILCMQDPANYVRAIKENNARHNRDALYLGVVPLVEYANDPSKVDLNFDYAEMLKNIEETVQRLICLNVLDPDFCDEIPLKGIGSEMVNRAFKTAQLNTPNEGTLTKERGVPDSTEKMPEIEIQGKRHITLS